VNSAALTTDCYGETPSLGILADQQLTVAVARLQLRAERRDDAEATKSFVDTGILSRLTGRTNYVLFGRRGTGKTHLLRALGTRTRGDGEALVVHVDLRTVGSSSQFSDRQLPIATRALALFRDILVRVSDAIRLETLEEPSAAVPAERVAAAIDAFDDAVLQPITEITETARSTRARQVRTSNRSAEVTAERAGLGAKVSRAAQVEAEGETSATYQIATVDKVHYADVVHALQALLALLNVRVLLLLDEWSNLPTDVQPYVAEHLRHTLIPLRDVTLIIAALEHRSQFSLLTTDRRIGLELGADIFLLADLDEHYSRRVRDGGLSDAFAGVLWSHLHTDLPLDHLSARFGVRDAVSLANRVFASPTVLAELCTASAGIPRDFLSIFSRAHYEANRRQALRIDRGHIAEAAREWFVRDKFPNLSERLQACLSAVADAVTSTGAHHQFVVATRFRENAALQHLLDARVLHLLDRAYTVGGSLASFRLLLSLDYGLYARRFPPRADVAPESSCLATALDEAAGALLSLTSP
jgi:hypothetical protein